METDQTQHVMLDIHDYSLLRHNTFGIDAKCSRFLEYADETEALQVASILREEEQPFLIIGGGSNLLLTRDLEGIVVHTAMKGCEVKDTQLTCGSGMMWDEVVALSLDSELYGMERGSYNIAFGSVELPRPEGEAKTFVIASCGNGINVFSRLQKEEKPFYAGIIYENDIDYHVARYLAQEVVSVPAFTETSEKDFERAAALMDRCDEVINAGFPKGARILERLEEKARAEGKLKGPAASD